MVTFSTQLEALCFSFLLQHNKPPKPQWFKTAVILLSLTMLQDDWPQLDDASALNGVNWSFSHLGPGPGGHV